MRVATEQKIILVVTTVIVVFVLGVTIQSPDFMCSIYSFETICISNRNPLVVIANHKIPVIAMILLVGSILWAHIGKSG